MHASIIIVTMHFAAAVSSAVSAEAGIDPVIGTWLNPERTAQVKTAGCGHSLCATVVWASPDAVRKAKNAGTDPLLGLQLLSDYRRKPGSKWQGQVFVPDMNRHFFSRIEPVGLNKMRLSGCVLGGLICKSTIWTRVEHSIDVLESGIRANPPHPDSPPVAAR
jgi:uncharacterized protein (DUF2147 family)